MANDIFNYCVATNHGKGFITHDDSRRFWISGYPANIWVCTDCVESRHWVARNNGVSKTKSEARTLVTAEIDAAKTAWDDNNVSEETAEEKIIRLGNKPTDRTLP